MSSSESYSKGLKTTSEILAYIHDHYLNQQTHLPNSVVWDCVIEPGILPNAMDKTRNKWSNAAYRGNWNALLKIAVESTGNLGIANTIRLRRKHDSEDAAEHALSGYTALHQAAWWGAPIEIVRGLIELGASRGMRTLDGTRRRPLDIAREKGHTHLYGILTPTGLPEISDDELSQAEAHFHKLILERDSTGAFKPESMRLRLPDLGMLRDLPRVSMLVPGMFKFANIEFWWSGDHLAAEFTHSYHITAGKATLVAQDLSLPIPIKK